MRSAFLDPFEIQLALFMSVHPSVRMGQLDSHWTDFHPLLYLKIYRKCIKKIQVSLKYDKNDG